MVDAAGRGENPDCLFQQLSNADKMTTYRALRNVQNGSDNLPALSLYIGQGEGYHVYPQGTDPQAGFCSQAVERKTPAGRAREHSSGDDTWAAFEKIKKEHAPELAARERERVENPEAPARRIERLADRAISGDEQARLDLRRSLESLMGDRNKDYREAVLGQMVKDGAYTSFNDTPHATLATGADGKPASITFSRNLGISKQTIPLDKPVSQQVDEAQGAYFRSLQMVVGGLGKFDIDGTMRAQDILMGSEPGNLRWFMLYRKEQGRPAVDLKDQ